MTDRPKFFDDLAGVAGGAMSALAGLREEVESTARARAEDIIRKLDLVRREELEAVQELAANARSALATAEARLAALEAKVSALPQTSAASASSASTAIPMTGSSAPDDAVAEGSPS